MATINRKYLTAELADGRTEKVRILFADQTRLTTTARTRKWDEDDRAGLKGNAFLFWHAAKREGILDQTVTFEEFTESHILDLEFEAVESGSDPDESHAGEGSDEDPTSVGT